MSMRSCFVVRPAIDALKWVAEPDFKGQYLGARIAAILHAWSPPTRPVVAISEHWSRFGSPQAIGVARHVLPEGVV